MTRKPKTGSLETFQFRDPATGRLIRDRTGKALLIVAYTPKAAKHRAKAATGGAVVVEART
jgi:hypothetical protein